MRRIEGVSSRLLEAAKEEFLKKGFEASSVREIAEKAETSPRAIYTRFENKAALFDAIVKNAEKEFKQIFAEEKEKFYKGKYKNSKETYYVKMIEYAYKHEEEFLLILTKSKGTKYENFTKQLAQDDIKGLKAVLNNSAIKEFFPTIKNEATVLSFIENITYSFYDNLFSPLVKKEPLENAKEYVCLITSFYFSGLNLK